MALKPLSPSLPPALPSLSSPNGDKAAADHHHDHHDDVGIGGEKIDKKLEFLTFAHGDTSYSDDQSQTYC